LPPGCLDGTRSAPSSSSRTVSKSLRNASGTDTSSRSRSGMISARSTDVRGEAESTSLAVVSHARISRPRAGERASTEIARGFGSKCSESLARYGLRMSLPKTPRTCALADSALLSRGLPTWGMIVRGVCSELGTSARRIDETGCGSLLPTPTGAGNEGSPSMQKWAGHRRLAAMLPTCLASDHKGQSSALRIRQGHGGPRLTPSLAEDRGFTTRTDAGVFLTLREWMLGWPIGWTALGPLATDRFREWQSSHGVCSPKPSPPKGKQMLHSPSSISLANRCRRAWWLRYGEKIREPELTWAEVCRAIKQGKRLPGGARSKALGKEVHRLAELYLWMRPSKAAKLIDWNDLPGQCLAELIPHLPPAGSVPRRDVERRVTVKHDGVSFQGLIDLVGTAAHRVTESYDHKTTRDLRAYALLPHAVAVALKQPKRSLLNDLQACLYTLARAKETVPAAAGGLCRWNYTETDKARRSLPVVQYVPTAHARTIAADAATVAREVEKYRTIDDAIPDTTACDDYGGCWYRHEGHCTVRRKWGAVIVKVLQEAKDKKDMKTPKLKDLRRDTDKANADAEREAAKTKSKAKARDAEAEEDEEDEDAEEEDEAPPARRVAKKVKRKPAPPVEEDDEQDEDAEEDEEDEPPPAPKAKPKSARAAAQAEFDKAVPVDPYAAVDTARAGLMVAFGDWLHAIAAASGARGGKK
jgi:hypothetical protein